MTPSWVTINGAAIVKISEYSKTFCAQKSGAGLRQTLDFRQL